MSLAPPPSPMIPTRKVGAPWPSPPMLAMAFLQTPAHLQNGPPSCTGVNKAALWHVPSLLASYGLFDQRTFSLSMDSAVTSYRMALPPQQAFDTRRYHRRKRPGSACPRVVPRPLTSRRWITLKPLARGCATSDTRRAIVVPVSLFLG